MLLIYWFSSCYLPEVCQHSFQQSTDALHKVGGLCFAPFHPQQFIFPLSGHAGRFQVIRDICDCRNSLCTGKNLLAFAFHIAGRYQLFQNRCTGRRCSSPFFSVSFSNSLLKFCGLDVESWLNGFDSVEEAIKSSVELIRKHPLIPSDIKINGFIIDSITGELKILI